MVEDIIGSIQQLTLNRKLAVALPRTFAESKLFSQSIQLFCFNSPDDIYDYPLKFLMQKDSPLAEKLNEFIKDTSEYGIIMKWLNDYKYKAGKEIKYEYQTFSGKNLIIALVVLMLMSTFAFCIMLVERLVHKKVQQRSLPFWRLLEIIIDPHRHFLNRDLSY